MLLLRHILTAYTFFIQINYVYKFNIYKCTIIYKKYVYSSVYKVMVEYICKQCNKCYCINKVFITRNAL